MYNRAIVLGRLTADPELRQTPNGIPVTSFSLAVDRSFATRGGERQVDFLDIVAWRQTAEFVCRYFSKGRPILVEGSIQTRQYTDKNGVNRRVWEIVADQVSFTESKASAESGGGGGGGGGGGKEYTPPTAPEAPAAYSSGDVDDFSEMDDDGDLPF